MTIKNSLFMLLLLPRLLQAQVTVQRDPAALHLAENAYGALVDGTPITPVVLEGDYRIRIEIMGSSAEFTGRITLKALDAKHSLVHVPSRSFLALSGSELCTTGGNGEIVGAWIEDTAQSGKQSAAQPTATTYVPAHGTYTNCWSAPVWFFPAMVLADIHDPTTAILNEPRSGGGSVLRLYQMPQGAPDLWKNLTALEVYLDSQSSLPRSIVFWRGAFGSKAELPLPPSDPLSQVNSPLTIHYSDYRKEQGILMPFSIDSSIVGGGGMSMSVKIKSVQFESALHAGDFALPAKVEKEKEIGGNGH